MQEILDFLQSLDWSPLVISIKTGIVATILSFFFGIFAARAVMKLRPWHVAVVVGRADQIYFYLVRFFKRQLLQQKMPFHQDRAVCCDFPAERKSHLQNCESYV